MNLPPTRVVNGATCLQVGELSPGFRSGMGILPVRVQGWHGQAAFGFAASRPRLFLALRLGTVFAMLARHTPRPLRAEATAVRPASSFLIANVAAELGILLVLSVLFPVLIHVVPVPENTRLGPMLMPIFYAPLLATLVGRIQTAWLVALAAPWLNWALTQHPSPRSAIVMTVQLLVFVGVLRLLLARIGPRWFFAVPAFFAGLAVSMGVAAIFPELIGGRPVLAWAAQTVKMGWPGIAILGMINWLAVRHYPTEPNGGAPAAA